MLAGIHKLLDEADAVITWNGQRFDIPTLQTEFLLHKLGPPSPYKHIDLLRVSKSSFRFPSNKMDYVAQRLGHAGKIETGGMKLWKGCMSGDPESWATMEQYNRADIRVLRECYDDLRPWIRVHPNAGLHDEPGLPVCPNCGSGNLQRRGYAYTALNKYARYRCECGKWCREAASELPKEDRANIMRPVN